MDRFPKENLSAFWNFLRAKYEAFTGAVEVTSLPYYAMMDPCDLCQLRCPTCPTGIENEGRRTGNRLDTTYRVDRAVMKPELFDALLEDMAEHLFMLELHSWGEPLLNRHVTSFARKARAKKIEVHMHTNLSLPLSDERVEDLVACGLDCLFASIDGFSQQAYERFRVGGDVELAKRNMERLVRARERLGVTTAIVYKFLVFRWNEHEVPAARRFAEEAGLVFLPQDACITDQSWLPSHRESERPSLAAADVDVLDRRAAVAGSPGYWKAHEKHSYWLPIAPGHQWIPPAEARGDAFCGWHYSTSVIQPRGHLAPCCFTAKTEDRFGQVTPGHVRVADVWNGAPYRRSRAAFGARNAEGTNGVDTVCVRCHLPEPLRHVFSHNDSKIKNQFDHLFGARKPLLSRAFELLSAGESSEARTRYVRHFEQHLLTPDGVMPN